VELDGNVALKIIQHANSHQYEDVSGHLLGLEREDTILEVTNCFPYPSGDDIEGENDPVNVQDYQLEMMRCLREVNVDYTSVGWFTTALNMGSCVNGNTIEFQFKFQEHIKKSIVLVYDPVKASQGVLSLKAFRLSAAFMELYKSQNFSKESLAKTGLVFDEIFQEIGVRIHNTHLVNALLVELEESVTADSEFDRLELTGNGYLEKNLECIINGLDDLAVEHGKYQYFQRNLQRQAATQSAFLQKRKADNVARKAAGEELLPETDPNNKPLPEPTRYDSLFIENLVLRYCDQVNQFSSQSLAKLHLVSTLF